MRIPQHGYDAVFSLGVWFGSHEYVFACELLRDTTTGAYAQRSAVVPAYGASLLVTLLRWWITRFVSHGKPRGRNLPAHTYFSCERWVVNTRTSITGKPRAISLAFTAMY